MFRSTTSLIRSVRGNFRFSTEVTSTMVKDLRTKSGAPMMDCKKALSAPEVAGDMDKAMDWLRKKGIARASSNADRVASEGLIAVFSTPSKVTMVEINSETDFVSRNKDFQDYVAKIVSNINATQPAGVIEISEYLKSNIGNGTVQDSLGDIITVIRENIVIRRAQNFVTKDNSELLASYVHNKFGENLPSEIQMGKIASLLKMTLTPTPTDPSIVLPKAMEVSRRLAMHVVASQPPALYLTSDSVPNDVREKETAILREQSVTQVKKIEMLDKVVAGKLQKRLSEICLVEQAHVAEEGNPPVKKFLASLTGSLGGSELNVDSFSRWQLGGQ